MIAKSPEKDGRREMSRCSKEEARHRVEIVQSLVTKGLSRTSILQWCANEWGIQQRMVKKYLDRALQTNAKRVFDSGRALTAEQALLLRAEHYNIYRGIVERAIGAKEYDTAIKALAQAEKTLGIDVPQKFAQITADGEQDAYIARVENLTDEQVEVLASIGVTFEGDVPEGLGFDDGFEDAEYPYKDSTKDCIQPIRPENEGW